MNREELEKRKADFLRRLEEEPPFDKETFEANMKAAHGTMREWAIPIGLTQANVAKHRKDLGSWELRKRRAWRAETSITCLMPIGMEWAQMQEDGSIGVHTSGYAADGTHGTGGFVVLPSDEDYEKAKQYYSLSKPGDTYHLQQKWIDGQWVTVLEERPDRKTDAGKAKSA